jgi:hypothetical protein
LVRLEVVDRLMQRGEQPAAGAFDTLEPVPLERRKAELLGRADEVA